MLGSRKFGFTGITYDVTDISRIINQGAVSFSYLTMPGGPRTMLNYMQSFGVATTDQNTGTGLWLSSFSGNLPYDASPLTGNNFFTQWGRVRIIDGDGTAIDGPDRTVFNFGQPNGAASFRNNTANKNYGGVGTTAPGGHNGGTGMTTAYVWGFSPESGWQMLHKNTLGNPSAGLTFTGGAWFTSSPGSPQSSASDGKRRAWSFDPITHFGFSVQ